MGAGRDAGAGEEVTLLGPAVFCAMMACSKSLLFLSATTFSYLVTAGHSRSKNGVASLAYDPVVHADLRGQRLFRMDCRIKSGNDE
jgi:hypothetical protein